MNPFESLKKENPLKIWIMIYFEWKKKKLPNPRWIVHFKQNRVLCTEVFINVCVLKSNERS